MTVKVKMGPTIGDLSISIATLEKMLPKYKEDYETAIKKVNSSSLYSEECELSYREKVALNMYRQYEQYEAQLRLKQEMVSKYWDLYLSAIEKRVLHAYSEEDNPNYELTDEELEALNYLDSPEMRNIRR